MPKLAVAYHKSFLLHYAGPNHPERAERVVTIMNALRELPWWDSVEKVVPREATQAEISMIHHPGYVEAMRRLCDAGGEFLPSMEAAVGEESYPAALRAAGAGLSLADGIIEGRYQMGFAPVRPPGHHSIYARPWGFCIFNNIAILAKYLINVHNLERVGILDFDAHHGNGTEQAFWTDSKVLFCSIHQENTFPSDTGDWHDRGEGYGENFTVNIPFRGRADDETFLRALDRYATPAFMEFKPQIILVSAGFDGYYLDILSTAKLTRTAYEGAAKLIKNYASGCDGKIITLLEGGYDLQGLTECITGYMNVLMEDD